MTIPKDGKPFDIDTRLKATEDEVEVIQYMYPSGARRRMLASVGKDYVKKAKNLIISAKVLPKNGKVIIYVRKIDESEENEINDIADNGPSERDPNTVLKELIDKKQGD